MPIEVDCLTSASDPGDAQVAVAAGLLHVHLDDGRDVHLRLRDLLAAVADLAERRAVLDDEHALVLDPLTPPQHPSEVVLQLRLANGGEEIGTRRTDSETFDSALHAAWDELVRYAQDVDDQRLLSELDIPHGQHYWPGAGHAA